MRPTSRHRAVFLLLILSTAATSAATEVITTTVSAAAFRPKSSGDVTFLGGDGYLYDLDGDESNLAYEYVVATLELPHGAEIKQVCIFAYTPPDNGFAAYLRLHRRSLASPGDPAPTPTQILAVNNENDAPGYEISCSAFASHGIVQPSEDIDASEGEEYVDWRLQADIGPGNGFGGAAIRWQRTVSPAPETATFGDVPVGDPFFPFVEPLGASAISSGCGGGKYCSDAPVTRGQMAVFLARALGLHWAD